MTILILGLVIFLGLHSVRVFAEGWRNRTRVRQPSASTRTECTPKKITRPRIRIVMTPSFE